jgi:hypothetical protein
MRRYLIMLTTQREIRYLRNSFAVPGRTTSNDGWLPCAYAGTTIGHTVTWRIPNPESHLAERISSRGAGQAVWVGDNVERIPLCDGVK